MSTTTATLVAARPETTSPTLRRTTVVVGACAAAAVTALAATAHAAGVPFRIDGEAIPPAGFAQLTFVCALVGGVLAAALRRRSAAPARRFVQVTAGLVVLSCLPSVALPPDVATRAALVATHLLAAAVIVPALARRLAD